MPDFVGEGVSTEDHERHTYNFFLGAELRVDQEEAVKVGEDIRGQAEPPAHDLSHLRTTTVVLDAVATVAGTSKKAGAASLEPSLRGPSVEHGGEHG